MRVLYLFAVFVLSCCSQPDRFHVLYESRHIGAPGVFHEENGGVFLTWEGETSISAGAYRNSYANVSIAGFASRKLAGDEWVSAHFFGGIAHYPEHKNRLIPLGGVELRVASIFVQLIPVFVEPVDGLLTFGLTRKF